MGGHAEGEVAAQMALQSIASQFQREAAPRLRDVTSFLVSALLQAHQQILRYAQQRRMPDSPRTTLVAAVVQGGELTWVHCGDSRLYWVRQGKLLQRTRDHSFVEMAHSGALPPGDPRLSNRNILFTCLGAAQNPIFDVGGPYPLEQGDRVLLCSDGLWDVLPEASLLHGLSVAGLDSAVPSLVDAALLAAGRHSDNVTALAMEWQQIDNVGASPAMAPASEAEDSVFHSTIQPQVRGTELSTEELDDSEIERAISEINEAIRRASPGQKR